MASMRAAALQGDDEVDADGVVRLRPPAASAGSLFLPIVLAHCQYRC
jgi:hypothetical protein